MAKTKISEYDATASNNTDVNSVDIAEGCAPSGVNNAIREVMGALKRMDAGTDALTSPDINGGTMNSATINASTVGASTPSTGAFTNLSANSLALGGTALTATAAQLNTLASGSAANDGTITVTAGNALTGGGNFTVNQAGNTGITINHEDTSTQATVTNSGTTYIQSIGLDTYGHITSINSGTVSGGTAANNSTITLQGASGLSGGGTFTTNTASDSTISITHADTSSQATSTNTGNNFIQSVTLDTYGHITGLTAAAATVSSPATYSAGGSFTDQRLSALGSSTENRLYMGVYIYKPGRIGTWSSATGGGWFLADPSITVTYIISGNFGTQAAGNFNMVFNSSDNQTYRFLLYLPAGVTVSSTQGDSQTPTASGVYVKVD